MGVIVSEGYEHSIFMVIIVKYPKSISPSPQHKKVEVECCKPASIFLINGN